MGVLWNPDNPVWLPALRALEADAPALDVKLYPVAARTPVELERGLSGLQGRSHALLVVRDMLFIEHRKQIVELAAQHRWATIFGTQDAVTDGGLMSYGANLPEMLGRAAVYVDRILEGAKPSELPVQQASTFDLVINQRTARQLGIALPEALLLRATQGSAEAAHRLGLDSTGQRTRDQRPDPDRAGQQIPRRIRIMPRSSRALKGCSSYEAPRRLRLCGLFR